MIDSYNVNWEAELSLQGRHEWSRSPGSFHGGTSWLLLHSNGHVSLLKIGKRDNTNFYHKLDISMPVMDGLESTRHIRDLERKLSSSPIPIFALTGLASDETQQEAFASGVDIFLTKPVRFNVLTAHLAERGLI